MRITTAIIMIVGIAATLQPIWPTHGQQLVQPQSYATGEQSQKYEPTEPPEAVPGDQHAKFWQAWPIESRYVFPAPTTIDSRFAYPVGDAGLRRLGPCTGACEVGCQAGRLWYRAEILGWDTKGVNIPTLVTEDTPDSPLFAGGSLHDNIRLGGRLTVGVWCTPAQRVGVEAVYFGLGGRDISYFADSEIFPVITRPYTIAPGGPTALHLVADDDEALPIEDRISGSSLGRVDSEMVGAEIVVRKAVAWSRARRVDLLVGYRHAHLFDRIFVLDQSISRDAMSDLETIFDREDLFRTDNDFHGGEVGIAARWWRGCWSWQVQSKLAYGGVLRRRTIAGQTTDTDFSGPDPVETTVDGGVLALPTNMGIRKSSDASLLAELGFTLEYQIRHNMRLALGYTWLYWDAVTRVNGLINTSINPTQIPPGVLMGDALPEFPLERVTSFWAQGLQASFEYQF